MFMQEVLHLKMTFWNKKTFWKPLFAFFLSKKHNAQIMHWYVKIWRRKFFKNKTTVDFKYSQLIMVKINEKRAFFKYLIWQLEENNNKLIVKLLTRKSPLAFLHLIVLLGILHSKTNHFQISIPGRTVESLCAKNIFKHFELFLNSVTANTYH